MNTVTRTRAVLLTKAELAVQLKETPGWAKAKNGHTSNLKPLRHFPSAKWTERKADLLNAPRYEDGERSSPELTAAYVKHYEMLNSAANLAK